MPLYRKLHVKTVDSIDINEMPDDFTRLMWTWLTLKLDSKGRGIDDSQWLRSVLFPLRRDVTSAMIEAAMSWYEQRGMIFRYTVGVRYFFSIPSFFRYQGKTDREAPSVIPDPIESKSAQKKNNARSKSRPTQDPLLTNSGSGTGIDASTGIDTEAGVGADAPKRKGRQMSKACEAFHDHTRAWPNHDQELEIDSAVKDDALDLWNQVLRGWMLEGYSPKNVAGMLDWFKRGITAKPNSNRNGILATEQIAPRKMKRWDE